MRHGSLFSGIGGFDLAAEWMGWENVFHCEWNEFGQKVLKYYWPEAESFGDITKTDFKKYANTIDILTGGFPCQPFSMAGKRKGTNDERYLWHEMLRAIQEIKPQFVIAENVFGITNIDGGLVFEQVCLDLENEGYEVQPFIIAAAAKNAPHRRDRCWFVAFKNSMFSGCIHGESNEKGTEVREFWNISTGSTDGVYLSEGNATDTDSRGLEGSVEVGRNCEYVIGQNGTSSQTRNATNTNGNGLNQRNGNDEINASEGRQYAFGNAEQGNGNGNASNSNSTSTQCGNCEATERWKDQGGRIEPLGFNMEWEKFPTQSPICGGDDGLPTKLDGITFSKWRAESIKGYGNAIVPQVALELFKVIEEFKNILK